MKTLAELRKAIKPIGFNVKTKQLHPQKGFSMIYPPKDTDELMRLILSILPRATFEEDNDGQIVIYTGLQEEIVQVTSTRLKDMSLEDEENKSC